MVTPIVVKFVISFLTSSIVFIVAVVVLVILLIRFCVCVIVVGGSVGVGVGVSAATMVALLTQSLGALNALSPSLWMRISSDEELLFSTMTVDPDGILTKPMTLPFGVRILC